MGAVARTGRARDRLARLRRDAELKTHEAIRKAADAALEVAQSLAPGRLPQTLHVRPLNQYAVRISSSSKVAVFHENGTAPHEIRPHGRVLRFEVNGTVRFARSVKHPGNEAIHFMQRGADVGRLMLRRLLREILR